MSAKLAVSINGEVVLEYDRTVTLTESQRDSLKKMEARMDEGINLAGQNISNPDKSQRLHFIAMNLIQALLQEGSDAMIAASTAYLAENLPDLKQITADTKNGQPLIDLVFDKEYKNQLKVDFNVF